MYRLKKYIIAMGAMIGMTLVSLLMVSTLTYLFKWQADKAMIGIIVTYIFVGFMGGQCLKRLEKRQYNNVEKGIGHNARESIVLSGIFMFLLFVLSIFAFQNSFEISGRLIMIFLLLMSSTFLGRIL